MYIMLGISITNNFNTLLAKHDMPIVASTIGIILVVSLLHTCVKDGVMADKVVIGKRPKTVEVKIIS